MLGNLNGSLYASIWSFCTLFMWIKEFLLELVPLTIRFSIPPLSYILGPFIKLFHDSKKYFWPWERLPAENKLFPHWWTCFNSLLEGLKIETFWVWFPKNVILTYLCWFLPPYTIKDFVVAKITVAASFSNGLSWHHYVVFI